MKHVLLALMILPAAARAQEFKTLEDLTRAFEGPISACWEAAETDEARRACKGLLYHACTAGWDDGLSNQGDRTCISAEVRFWDDLLNAEWAKLVSRMKEQDSQESSEVYAKREETLRAAELAWIAFRDAECEFRYAKYGSGTLYPRFFTICHADLTFERVLDFVGVWDEFEKGGPYSPR